MAALYTVNGVEAGTFDEALGLLRSVRDQWRGANAAKVAAAEAEAEAEALSMAITAGDVAEVSAADLAGGDA